MPEPQLAEVRSRKPRIFICTIIAALAIVGWFNRQQFALIRSLHATASEVLGRRDIDHPKSSSDLAASAMAAFAINGDMLGTLQEFAPADIAAHLRFDPSARRRAVAAASLASIDPMHARNWRGVGAQLVHTLAYDSSPTVRLVARQVLSSSNIPKAEVFEALRAAERLPTRNLGEVLLALGQHHLSEADSLLRPLIVVPKTERSVELERTSSPPAADSRSNRFDELLLKLARRGQPEYQLWAIAQVGDKMPRPEAVSIVESAIPLASIDPMNWDLVNAKAAALAKYAPEEALNRFRSGGEESIRLLTSLSAHLRKADPTTQAAALQAAIEILESDDKSNWQLAYKVVQQVDYCWKPMAELLTKASLPHRGQLIKVVFYRYPDRDRPQPKIEELPIIAAITTGEETDIADAIAYQFYCSYAGGVASMKWTEQDRERFRKRMARSPIPGNAWYLACQVTAQESPNEQDIRAFEAFLETCMPLYNETNAFDQWPKQEFVNWYWKHAGKTRAAPRLLQAIRERADNSFFVANMVAVIKTDEALLEEIANPIIERAASSDKFAFDRYGQLAFRLLEKKPRTIAPKILSALWKNAIPHMPADRETIHSIDAFKNTVTETSMSLADARNLLPDEIATKGVRDYIASLFVASDAATGDDKLPVARNADSSFVFNHAITTMPEFKEEFAKHVNTAARSKDSNVRRFALKAIDTCRANKELFAEVLHRLLQDSDERVVSEALQFVGERNGAFITPKIAEAVRKLCLHGSPAVRCTAIYCILDLPERGESDRAIAEAAAHDSDERIRYAGNFVLKRWNDKKT